MAKFPTLSPLVIAYFALVLSISLNLSAIYIFRHRPDPCERVLVDDSRFSYVGDDHPHELPIHIPNIALTVENSETYGLSDFQAWVDWRTLDAFPHSNGFVKLGPEGEICLGCNEDTRRLTSLQAKPLVIMRGGDVGKLLLTTLAGIAMFHQMHCLQKIREAITQGDAGMHVRHCLNLLRQAILCASDTTLDPMNKPNGTDGLGVVHICRDWEKVYDFVDENQRQHASSYNRPEGHDEQ
ncbi:hypothetical protein SCP_0404760 [Sparassis crispa]|uniref:Oxidase ustYa n=1 Tax=Sparassis crispa TaxID=139825 RepID=A0A401GIU1_9APHY|nr:hypothetical protein SCP_0404760 [Sparassis crispa]GBE82097.1 hypothetical protein SCP_0404760 [Sparassis crispa]